tara:strand:- start:11114 stop:11275 length:162 start_codon:yes stop_codon:yes gene_type:complete
MNSEISDKLREFYDYVVENNYQPEDIFSKAELEIWAEDNDWVKSCCQKNKGSE